ncbi:hypothetical protein [Vibrio phage RYC]|nr:hypothetical protein [Vibrio phage RYC]
MLRDQALEFKKQFSHFQSSIDYDFDVNNGWYVIVTSNKDYSQYLIKGAAHSPYIVAVGLGSNGIGFKRLSISLGELRKHLKKS